MRNKLLPVLSLLLLLVLTVLVICANSVEVTEGGALDGVVKGPPRPTATPAAPFDPSKSLKRLGDVTQLETRPDLVVEKITVSPSTPYISTSCVISVTVMNVGSADVAPDNNFFIDFYMDPGLPPESLPGVTGVISWCAQAQDFPKGGRKTFGVTYVFTEPYAHQVYAQVDSPEGGISWYGNVYEGLAGEHNNVFPASGAGMRIAAQPRYSVTQGTQLEFYQNYASTLQVVGNRGVSTYHDLYGHVITSDASLRLGLFEEPPVTWGTVGTPPDFKTADYNMTNPDQMMNAVVTNDQVNPKIATNPISGSNQVATVWEDHRTNKNNADIYLRWAMEETGAVGCPQHPREDWGTDLAPHEMKVNDNPAGTTINGAPAIAISENGWVVVAWQRKVSAFARSDIYLQQFHFNPGAHQLDRIGPNRRLVPRPECEGTDLRNPKVAQLPNNQFFVAWEGNCPASHSNIWLARSAPLTGGGDFSWELWRIANDPDAESATNPDLSVALVSTVGQIGEPYWNPMTGRWEADYGIVKVPWVALTWEGITHTQGITKPTVYSTLSIDTGDTFQGDQEISDNNNLEPFRRTSDQPVLAFGQERRDIVVNVGGVEVTLVNAPFPNLHYAWRDFRNSSGFEDSKTFPDARFKGNNPDIRYRNCSFWGAPDPPHVANLMRDFCFASKQLNTNDVFAWQKRPAKQTSPTIAARLYPTEPERFFYSDVYVAWSDNRNYYDDDDDANFDIYMAVPYADAIPSYLKDYNAILNDEAKIRLYDTTLITDRLPDIPPAAWQDKPSIAVNAWHLPKSDDWGLTDAGNVNRGTGWLYVAWMDTRDTRQGNYPNFWDIYAARSNLTYYHNNDKNNFGTICDYTLPCDQYGAGSYISRAFDAHASDARWFSLWYQGNKDEIAYPPAFRTRIANSVDELLTATWWPQTQAITKGCEVPLWGYIDSGSDIISGTQTWPQGRYMQYRANFWTRSPGSGKSPEVYWVRAYYDFPSTAGGIIDPPGVMMPRQWIPVILKGD